MRISSIWNASILLCILSFQNIAQISSFQYPTFSVVNDSFRVTRKKSHSVFLSSKRSVPVVPNNGAIFATTRERYDNEIEEKQTEVPRVVLVTGFESFNRDLYRTILRHQNFLKKYILTFLQTWTFDVMEVQM